MPGVAGDLPSGTSMTASDVDYQDQVDEPVCTPHEGALEERARSAKIK